MQKEGKAIPMTRRPGSMEAGGLGGKEKENRNGKIFTPVSILNKKKNNTEHPAKMIQKSHKQPI